MPTRLAHLVAPATLLLSCAEAAADLAGTAATRATLQPAAAPSTALFEFPTDSDWYKIKLKAGRDYAVSVRSQNPDAGAKVLIRDPKGIVLAGVDESPYTTAGLEFRAAKTATYYLEYRAPGGATPVPLTYHPHIVDDCRGDPVTTSCTLEQGTPQQRQLAFAADVDAYRFVAEAGRAYSVRLTTPEAPWGANLEIQDAAGTRVVSASGNVPMQDGTNGLIVTFLAQATASYYAVVGTSDDAGGSRYLLKLSPASLRDVGAAPTGRVR